MAYPVLPTLRGLRFPTLAVAVIVVLFSCATTNNSFSFGEGESGVGAVGWVAFIRDDVDVFVKKLTEGVESSPLRLSKGNVPAAIPCPPGPSEFIVYDKTGPLQQLVVPVIEGAVTCVGIRKVVLEWRWTRSESGWELDAVRYLVRCSVGSHPLPSDPAASDPAPFFAALEDQDWATRLIAIGTLERIDPPLDEKRWNLLASLYREDSSALVWKTAGHFFRATRNQMPQPPVAVAYLDRYNYGLSLESNRQIERALVTDGYRIASKFEGQSFCEMLRGSSIKADPELEYALECYWTAGNTTRPFGLAVGRDDNNYDVFCVSQDGGTAVLSVRGGSVQATPIPWSHVFLDPFDESPMVRIGVSRRGSEYTMTVNGRTVGSFTDKDVGSGVVGLYVDGCQAVVFHKLVAYHPPKPFAGTR